MPETHMPPPAPPPIKPALITVKPRGFAIHGSGVKSFTRGETISYLVACNYFTLEQAAALVDALAAHTGPPPPPTDVQLRPLSWSRLNERTLRLNETATTDTAAAAVLSYCMDGHWWLHSGPLAQAPADCGGDLNEAMNRSHAHYCHASTPPATAL